MSEVCENCNRPMVSAEEWIAAVEKINGWPDLCHNDGTGDTYSAQEFCAEARDKWLTAEVARLRTELAEARKPRWVPDLRHAYLNLVVDGQIEATVAKYASHQGYFTDFFSPDGSYPLRYYPTVAEAMAAAEKACGVDAA